MSRQSVPDNQFIKRPFVHTQVPTHLCGNIGNRGLGDSTHTVDPRITRVSSFRFLVNGTQRRENVLKSLERVIR